MMYMPKHIRIGKTPLISFYFVTLRSKATPCSHFLKYKQTLWVCFVGAANFCICLLKALDRILRLCPAPFSQTSIKNYARAEWIKAVSFDPQ